MANTCRWTVHADRTYCLEMAQRCDSTRYTAKQALEILQNIASDESGVDDYSDEEEQNETFQLLKNVTREPGGVYVPYGVQIPKET